MIMELLVITVVFYNIEACSCNLDKFTLAGHLCSIIIFIIRTFCFIFWLMKYCRLSSAIYRGGKYTVCRLLTVVIPFMYIVLQRLKFGKLFSLQNSNIIEHLKKRNLKYSWLNKVQILPQDSTEQCILGRNEAAIDERIL